MSYMYKPLNDNSFKSDVIARELLKHDSLMHISQIYFNTHGMAYCDSLINSSTCDTIYRNTAIYNPLLLGSKCYLLFENPTIRTTNPNITCSTHTEIELPVSGTTAFLNCNMGKRFPNYQIEDAKKKVVYLIIHPPQSVIDYLSTDEYKQNRDSIKEALSFDDMYHQLKCKYDNIELDYSRLKEKCDEVVKINKRLTASNKALLSTIQIAEDNYKTNIQQTANTIEDMNAKYNKLVKDIETNYTNAMKSTEQKYKDMENKLEEYKIKYANALAEARSINVQYNTLIANYNELSKDHAKIKKDNDTNSRLYARLDYEFKRIVNDGYLTEG